MQCGRRSQLNEIDMVLFCNDTIDVLTRETGLVPRKRDSFEYLRFKNKIIPANLSYAYFQCVF